MGEQPRWFVDDQPRPVLGDDVATFCDTCGADIPYHVTCYSVPTGRDHDGTPVVRIECAGCYRGPAVGTAPANAIREEDLP